MMKILISILSLLSLSAFADTTKICEYFPKNNLSFPVTFNENGITRDDYLKIIKKAEQIFNDFLSGNLSKIDIPDYWNEKEVNAYASKVAPNHLRVSMYGGLARYPIMTPDAFALVTCHEIGHHLGGAPKYEGSMAWASLEGQSDYWGAMKCLRKMFEDEDNEAVLRQKIIPEIAKNECSLYLNSADKANCIRRSIAGLELSNVFREVGQEVKTISLNTPDARVVTKTIIMHPRSQCRLDTYFRGALCDKDLSFAVSDENEAIGFCSEKSGEIIGARSKCWYFEK